MYKIILYSNVPQGQLKFQFSIADSIYDATETHTFLKLGKFETGSDHDKDTLFFPNNFEVEFKIEGSKALWFEVLKELRSLKTIVQVYLDDQWIFAGYAYSKNIDSDFVQQTIKVKVIDQFLKLKDIDPRTNPFGFTLGTPMKVTEFLYEILLYATFLDGAYVSDVVSECTYEATIGDGSVNIDFLNFGIMPNKYFTSSSSYTTMLEVFKQVLLTFGCKGYIGFDRKFHMVPRIYSDQSVKTIMPSDRKSSVETDIVFAKKGLQVFIHDGNGDDTHDYEYEEYALGTVENDSNGNLVNPDSVEILRIDEPCGTLPYTLNGSSGYSGLYCWYDNTWYVADFDSIRRKNSDGSYTSRQSLWQLTSNDAWDLARYDKSNFKINCAGKFVDGKSTLLSDYTMSKFFNLSEFPSFVMHARKISYDFKKNIAELDCIE